MNKYKQLVDIKAQIDQLTNQYNTLKDEILNEVVEKDGEKFTTEYATFSVQYRPKWEYSDKLKEKEKLIKDKIKVMKKEEELNGTATKISDNATLRVQLVKEQQ